jgi:hypothetical protein
LVKSTTNALPVLIGPTTVKLNSGIQLQ